MLHERLMERLETSTLRDGYAAWHRARAGDAIPRLAALEPLLSAHAERLFIAEVEPRENGTVAFHFLSVGPALRASLGHPLASREAADEETLGALESAYRRAVRTRSPSYEYARYFLGGAPPLLFERLLLPVSSAGQHVSHLVGLVVLAEPVSPAP